MSIVRLGLWVLAGAMIFAGPATAAPLADVPIIVGLKSRYADVGGGVRLHYWFGGTGAPVVLLHGWPETGYAWRKVVPGLLAAGYAVVVPDLRGFGDSSRPQSGYDRLTMADDIHRLIHDHLHMGPVYLVGHDWGGSTAAAWAGAHPEDVRRLVVIEAQPRGPWSKAEPWFYAFHRSRGFPEAMTAGRERTYLTWFYRNFAADPVTIGELEIDVYMRTFGNPDGMRAGFELVRALPQDVAANIRAARMPSPVPVLAIGGEKGMGSAVAENLRPLFSQVRGEIIPGVAHFVPEEAPEALTALLLSFFASDAESPGSLQQPPQRARRDGRQS